MVRAAILRQLQQELVVAQGSEALELAAFTAATNHWKAAGLDLYELDYALNMQGKVPTDGEVFLRFVPYSEQN